MRLWLRFALVLSCTPLRLLAVVELIPMNDVYVCPADLTSPEQVISFICNVTESDPVVTWDIEVNGRSYHINFDSDSSLNLNKYSGIDGIYVTLILSSNQFLSSMVNVRIPPFDIIHHMVVLQCHSLSRSLLQPGLPTAPVNLTAYNYLAVENDTDVFKITLSWLPPISGSLIFVNIHYNLNIFPSPNSTYFSPVTISSTTLFLTLLHNIAYNVSVEAINCAGKSQKAQIIIFYQNYFEGLKLTDCTNVVANKKDFIFCSTPMAPSNFHIVNITSTEVGSILMYKCNNGYLPKLIVTSHCNITGMWEPDPSHHRCNIAATTGLKDVEHNQTTIEMQVSLNSLTEESEENKPFYKKLIFAVLVFGVVPSASLCLVVLAFVILLSCCVRHNRIKKKLVISAVNNTAASQSCENNGKCDDSHFYKVGLSHIIVQNDTYEMTNDSMEKIYETIQ